MKLIPTVSMAVCAASLFVNGCDGGGDGDGSSSTGGAKTGGQSGSGGSGTGGHVGSGGNGSGGTSSGSGGSASGGSGGSGSGGSGSGGVGIGGITASGGRSGSGGVGNGGVSGGGGAAGRDGGAGSGGVPGQDSGAGGAGTGGATGSGGATGACRPKFASGVNVAWFTYAGDIPNPDMTKFNKLYSDNSAVGGRIVRWWFHTNGAKTPTYDSSGLAAKISDANIADVKKILDGAAAAGQAVVVSLWSFNMLKSDQVSATILQNNKDLLQKDANRQAYVDNVITPLVTALKGHPGLYAWEAFNEPEGMINDGPNTSPWTGSNYVSIKDIQKCVNWFAAGVHTADPSALFTNGAWTFLANTDVDGHKNYYSDSQLTTIGGKSNGTLDFYQVHYYDNWGTVGGANSVSPFVYPASHWALDKPIMIGEFWDVDSPGPSNSTIKGADLYTTLYNNGYLGGWAWQYANADNPPPTSGDQTQWPAMKTAMQNLFTAHPADLACK
ncbi:MAG TPA: hypothetical protein VF550_21790 [Polyangia bacterium]